MPEPTEQVAAEGLAILRAAHPSFGRVADILVELADDPTVSPEVYERVCDAVFTVLNAYAEALAHA